MFEFCHFNGANVLIVLNDVQEKIQRDNKNFFIGVLILYSKYIYL